MPPLLEKAGKWVKEYGAIAPSSHFLAREMVRPISWRQVRLAVEFGAGSGVITREALQRLSPEGRLVVFEINPQACERLRRLGDPRLTVVNDRAEHAAQHLKGKMADCIISGVPIANLFSDKEFYGFMRAVHRHLKPDGVFVQFQYFLVSYWRLRRLFSDIEVRFSFLNIPPAFVYVCREAGALLH